MGGARPARRRDQPPAHRGRVAARCVLTLVLVLAGCPAREPDFAALYSGTHANPHRTPVILVHGILGGRLRDRAGTEIWPGSLWRLVTHDYAELALDADPDTLRPVDDGLEPFAFFDAAAGRDFYGRLVRTLTGPGGYRPAASADGPATFYPFFYDWRQDDAVNAARLDDLIESIRHEHEDPDLAVDVVAHSMGGLVVRYFVRYGREDVLDREDPVITFAGARKVRRLVLVGTPNFGSISGLQTALMGAPIGLARVPPEVGATWPSVFELLPDPSQDWMIGLHGERIDRDLYNVATWRDYQWSIFDPAARARIRDRRGAGPGTERYLATLERSFARNLTRARNFHRALSEPEPDCPVRYIVVGGDCEPTPARCLVEPLDGRTAVRLRPEDIANRVPGIDYEALMLEPGDGRVTKASALARAHLVTSTPAAEGAFPLAYSVFLCTAHGELPGDATFRDNLLDVLLAP